MSKAKSEIQKARTGTVVVLKSGRAAQKAGPDEWYLAQDWEGSCTDAAITKWGAKVVFVPADPKTPT